MIAAKPAREKELLGVISGPVEILQTGTARVVRQPPDGSCLYHSLSYGLRDGSSSSTLREELASFIAANPTLEISGSTLTDWVRTREPRAGETARIDVCKLDLCAWPSGAMGFREQRPNV